MATHRCNLSVARIDINALDLQRREAIVNMFSESIYKEKMNRAGTCGTVTTKCPTTEHAQNVDVEKINYIYIIVLEAFFS